MRIAIIALAVGCGAAPPATTRSTAVETEGQIAERERLRKEELSAAHRERLDEQSTALAAGCDKGQPAKPRCLPSCYAPEGADSREGKQLTGPVEIMHTVCARGDDGPFFIADELAAKLEVRKLRGRFPAPNKKGTWQFDVAAAVTSALEPPRGDVVRVTGTWNPVTHPVTKERWRCVPVSHYTKSARRAFDACGSQGAVACEAKGDSSAHGINVVHYRLLEARRLQSDGKTSECQQAALEAIAVARGMPRWRQYMSLNTDQWKPAKRFRTRFDGLLDEEGLFARAIELGTEAEAVYAACGGASRPKTEVSQEQSFHMCW
jgi:hypothetical protein